jgi:hypothetical protein
VSVLLLSQGANTHYVAALSETVPLSESLGVVKRTASSLSETVTALTESLAVASSVDALRFNAAADRLDMPAAGVPSSTGSWTVSGWIRIAASTGNDQVLWTFDGNFSSTWHNLTTGPTGTNLVLTSSGTTSLNFGTITIG